ncbi:MAG: hypothetical protein ACI4EE_14265 [Lachnospiraceae bacterium]
MENFKDCYQDDLENAFFDLDEFASTHTIDGKECAVLLMDTSVADGKMSYGLMKATLNPKESAINKVTHILFVREGDMRQKVTVNSLITLDNRKLFVQSVQKTEGVYKIALGIHQV